VRARYGASIALLLAALLFGCGGNSGSGYGGGSDGGSSESESTGGGGESSGERIEVGGTEALVWGDGERGVVLSHGAAYDAASWKPQAREIAKNDGAVLAVEETSKASIEAAANYLKEERGAKSITLIGASAGGGPVLEAAGSSDVADGVILLSSTGDVSNLGDYPKLFVASEGESMSSQVRQMAKDAPGGKNEALILSGDAHAQAIFDGDQGDKLLQAIIKRVKENS
jgi:pimeloyl-ACP methyl ester carboxylesterase